jgi:hypothetical protein
MIIPADGMLIVDVMRGSEGHGVASCERVKVARLEAPPRVVMSNV